MEELEKLLLHLKMLVINGWWGTCVDCPRDAGGNVMPENCQHFTRSDHRLTKETLFEAISRLVPNK